MPIARAAVADVPGSLPRRGFLAAMALSLPGCMSMRGWMRSDPMAGQPCVLPPDATKEQIVEHLNLNVSRTHGWRSTSVGIKMNGWPSAQGDLAVQQGHRFRLRVTSLPGLMLDMGSNEELFWFWARDAQQPGVLYARHEDAGMASRQLNMPFEPQWLMQAFGVLPYHADLMQMREGLTTGTAQLESNHTLDNGWQVRRIVVVDRCRGYVREHTLWDGSPRGQIIASAVLSKHFTDPQSGVVLPRRIDLSSPQSGDSVSLDLGNVMVNPPPADERLWQMPDMPNAPSINIGRSSRVSLDDVP